MIEVKDGRARYSIELKVFAENETLGRIMIQDDIWSGRVWEIQVNQYGNMVLKHGEETIECWPNNYDHPIEIGNVKIWFEHHGSSLNNDHYIEITVIENPLGKYDLDAILHEIIDMLNRYDIKDIIGEMGIVYGAAMVMHGVKPSTNDIDMCVSDSIFKELESRIAPSAPYKGNADHPYIHVPDTDIDIFKVDSMLTQPLYDIAPITKFAVQSLLSLIDEKTKRNRPKDWHDIGLIQDFIGRGGEHSWYIMISHPTGLPVR